MLRYLPALTVGLFLGPVVAGLIGTLLPAFGYLPVLGGEQFSLEPWRRLLAAPGLAAAVQVTLTTGFASTAIALVLTVVVFAGGHGTVALTRIRRAMVPLLAVPHLARDEVGRIRREDLVPLPESLSRISAYLDERRLVGSRLVIEPPDYQWLTAVISVRARARMASTMAPAWASPGRSLTKLRSIFSSVSGKRFR